MIKKKKRKKTPKVFRWNSLKNPLAIEYPLLVTAFLGSPVSSEGFWVMDINLLRPEDGKVDEFYNSLHLK